MKTSLRLAFSAVCVAFITLAASGAPLPFLSGASPAHAARAPSAPPPLDASLLSPDAKTLLSRP